MTEPRESSEPTKLEFKEAVVWRSPNLAAVDNMDAARDLAAKTGKLAILLGPGESIESLDKDQMRDAGWMPVSELEAAFRITEEMVERAMDEYGKHWLGGIVKSQAREPMRAALEAALGQKERNDD